MTIVATAHASVSGQRLWVKTVGTPGREAGAWDVAAGPDGVVCVGGWIGAPGSPEGVALLVKYNPSGARKWTRTYAGAGSAGIGQVAFDAKGNIYVSGETWRGGVEDIFVAKYSSAGVRKWLKTYDGGSGLPDWSEAIAVDKSGNVLVGGHSMASADLIEGIVVLKYGPTGARKWVARFDPAGVDEGPRVIKEMGIDRGGNAYVAAAAADGGAPDYPAHKALVFKVGASSGEIAWSKYYAGADGTGAGAYGIAVRGNAVVACGEASEWDTWHNQLLVLRYDRAGNEMHPPVEYDRSATTDDQGEDVAIDSAGNAYVTGNYLTTPAQYPSALALVKVSAAGEVRWAKAYSPSTHWAVGWWVRVDAANNAYVGGSVLLDAQGHMRFLIVKYSRSGARKWVKTWSARGVGFDQPDGITLGTTGGVYIAGQGNPGNLWRQAVLIKYRR